MGILVDLFPDCSLDEVDTFGVRESLFEKPDVVVVSGYNARVLQEIKAQNSGAMIVIEEISSEVDNSERSGIDHVWEVPYKHRQFIAAVEKFFHGKEELYGS
jgi:hypothetical protein